MSDWSTYKDQKPGREAPLRAELVRVLVERPGLLSKDYCALLPTFAASGVKRLLFVLRDRNFARTDRVHGIKGNAVVWYPTPALKRLVAAGELPSVFTKEVDPDEGWTPQPYVNPIRARALGLPSAMRKVA